MRKYKLLSYILSLMMALTVFGIPSGAFAVENDGNDSGAGDGGQGQYCLAYGDDTLLENGATVDFCDIGDSYIYPYELIDGAWELFYDGKLVCHNQYTDEAIVEIGYNDEYGDPCQTGDEEVVITGEDLSIGLLPQTPGTARLSVDIYGENTEEPLATISFNVVVTQEDIDAFQGSEEPEYTGSIDLGETFTWEASSDESNKHACLSVDPVDSDMVVRVKAESDGEASAYLYEVGAEGELLAWTSTDEDETPGAIKADKKHYIDIFREDAATEVTVSLEVNPIQEIRYQPAEPLYENTNGRWEIEYKFDEDGDITDEPTGKLYYEYCVDFNEGDKVTLVDADGNEDVYTCTPIDEDDYDYYQILVNENGDRISLGDIKLDDEQKQKQKHWTVGSDNVLYIEYQGLRQKLPVTIEESPVARVTVTPAGQYKVAEDEYEIETGLDGKKYYHFLIPGWQEGDKLKIEYKDGTTKEYVLSFDKYGYDVWTLVGGTERLDDDELSLDSDQLTKHWSRTVGATNSFFAVFMGVRSNELKAKIIRSLGKAKITLSAASLVYTGKARKPAVKTMKYGTTALKQGTHYALDYCDKAIGVGKYDIVFMGIGSYGGYKETSFKIIPKGATILKPKAAKKAITVKWKKQGTKMKYQNANYDTKSAYITGYQIQYALKSSFKGAKTKTVKGYKKTSLKVKKLKAKKKYYVRVRTYMTIKGVGTFYSTWSKAKAIKTKK